MAQYYLIDNPVYSSTLGAIHHYALVCIDGTVAYDCPWFTFSVNESDSTVLDVTFNNISNFSQASFESSATPTDGIYPLVNIQVSPMLTDFTSSGDPTYNVVSSVGEYNTETYGMDFKIQFVGSAVASSGQVQSAELGVVSSVAYPVNSGTVVNVTTDTIRLTVAADASNFPAATMVFFSSESQPDLGTKYEVLSFDATAGTVTFTVDVSSAALPGDGMFIGDYAVTLVTAGDDVNFSNLDTTYFSTENVASTGDGYTVEASSAGVVTYKNMPAGLTTENMFPSLNTFMVTDASIYSDGQKLMFLPADVYARPTSENTGTIESRDETNNFITLAEYPSGGISLSDYIFSGSTPWTFVKYTTTS